MRPEYGEAENENEISETEESLTFDISQFWRHGIALDSVLMSGSFTVLMMYNGQWELALTQSLALC